VKNLVIARAKTDLIIGQPFFATILLGLNMVEDTSIPTMSTDGETIKFNPQWTDSLTLPEVIFVLAHETLHCVFQHMHRREARNANRWNIAADYVINDLLQREGIGTMPKGGLLDSGLVAQGNGTTEGVYNLLPTETEGKDCGTNGGAMDQVTDAGKDAATIAQKESEMRVKVIQAKNAAKMAGKLSQGLERLIGDVTRVKTDWRSVLRNFLSERAKTDFSYAKPKRRFLAEDIYLPSLVGEKMGSVVIAIDCSGSVSAELLSQFSSEVNAIMADVKPSGAKILYFDYEVLKIDELDLESSPVSLKPIGGGGTRFSPIFKAIESLGAPPVAVVVLTDLQCNDFGPCPEYPVLWASTDYDKAAFGDVIKLEEN
jgi:predicted metal-dependent peptidase